MRFLNALTLTDFYKTDHRRQYPEGITNVYSNLTARESRLPGVGHVVAFGPSYFIQEYLIRQFNETFFRADRRTAVARYKRRLDHSLGPDAVPMDHIEGLYDLGYLPLVIKAIPEGTLVPIRVPMLTVEATNPRFAWLTNFIETALSATTWGPITSATTAHLYRTTFDRYARLTGADPDFCAWQGHDFSMRGMFGIEAAAMSGAAHLLSFTGTDTIPAIDFLEEYYGADCEAEMIGGSVPATEHSVMCAGGCSPEDEYLTYKRILTEIYPKGIVSIVSDTWDFWRVVTEVLPKLKDVILAREGKLVIRPDSGDPVKIIVGDPDASEWYERGGLINTLWNAFGGGETNKGYITLDSHIGAIYGDSITLARQQQILEGLYLKGFASSNVVLGIGSFTYQYTTRDVFGMAVKSTYCEVDGEPREIYKSPKGDKSKHSARGLISVRTDERGELVAHFPVSRHGESLSALQTVFFNSKQFNAPKLSEMRARLAEARRKALSA